MKRFKKLLLAALFVCMLMCTAAGVSVAVFAETAQASAWTSLAGWRDTSVIIDYEQDDGTKGVNIYQSSGTDFSVSYTKNPFYLDGFEFRFYADYTNGTRANGNLKIVMTRSGSVWWLEDNAAISLDLKYEEPTKCTVTLNTLNPNGYTNYATSAGAVSPAFYWDNSKENVVQIYFKEDGLLYFNINGTELDSSKNGLDTVRLRDWGIYDSFLNGQAYLQLWGQQLNATLRLDVRSEPTQMATPQFTAFDGDVEWSVEKGNVLSMKDGVCVRVFRNADANGFTVKKSEPVSLNNAYVNMNLALPQNGRVGYFYEGNEGNQVRVYLSNTSSENVSVAMFDGSKETLLYKGTHSFDLMDQSSPDYSHKINFQIKSIGKAYKFLLNGEFVECDLSALTNFIAENYEDSSAYLLVYMENEGIVKTISTAGQNDPSFTASFVNAAGSSATFAADGSSELIYSDANDGSFRIVNDNKHFWGDNFGLRFRLDKLTPGDATEFRIILSSSREWYQDAKSSAIIFSFAKDGENTDVEVLTYNGKSETSIGKGTTTEFSWNYAVENFVNFGNTAYGWMLIVGNNAVLLSGDYENALTAVKDSFENNIAWLQIENCGGENTALSVSDYVYMVEAFIAPRGWQQGHYLVAPQWGESAPGTETVFGSPGENYTVEKTAKVPFNGFKIEFAFAPGDDLTQISMALSDGSTDWYNTCWSIGVMFTYNPDSDMLKNGTIQMGIIYANPDEGLESTRVNNLTVPFKWYEKNTIEIRMFRGEYQLYLNGENVFDDFNDYAGKISAAYIGNVAELQFFNSGDITLRVYSTTELETVDPPAIQRAEVNKYNNAEYKVGEEISIDLAPMFTSESSSVLTYKVNIGKVEGTVWKYTPSEVGEIELTITASDGEQSSLPANITLKIIDGSKENGGSGGCGSAITSATALGGIAILAVAVTVVLRRKHDEI